MRLLKVAFVEILLPCFGVAVVIGLSLRFLQTVLPLTPVHTHSFAGAGFAFAAIAFSRWGIRDLWMVFVVAGGIQLTLAGAALAGVQ